MKIASIVSHLESLAPLSLQESYDNAGLIIGNSDWECTGILCSLDATEEVIREAAEKKCNLVISHHPIVFGGLKKINGHNYVERTVIEAIKRDIAVYAIHTNLDNMIEGVSGHMASKLQLKNIRVLAPKQSTLRKLYTFVPENKATEVRQAIFKAGGGHIGNYSECSFNTEGWGTFTAGGGSNPYVGKQGEQHQEKEIRIEVIFPSFQEKSILEAMKSAHPYEEVAFDIVQVANSHPGLGSGVIGELEQAMDEEALLQTIKGAFGLKVIRHTPLLKKPVKKVALCGGAGSFLISKALQAGVDLYITADVKYHEFFDANSSLVIADIGHYESEQFTIGLLQKILEEKFPTFAVLKTTVNTNPVHYF